MKIENGIPYLIDLEARNPVGFYAKEGSRVNNIEISRAMAELPLTGFTLHQSKDYKLTFNGWSNEELKDKVTEEIKAIFGEKIEVVVSIIKPELHDGRKTVTYRSDWEV
ncbi:hypothetical protein MYP_2955 [Sporocytophaga myxococcoides]|uniref:Uncharacterized protein n=1 Tax=Sporocytophaga myxococcoides TaxID=153721 RepID=A0A098LFJ3_9BACT|nr:hypothetical protein [Sporocytophaga myxococcoides]GAL85726.1 hypothetical protein MYP_2955 [Sporocytophaga myxococcoides]